MDPMIGKICDSTKLILHVDGTLQNVSEGAVYDRPLGLQYIGDLLETLIVQDQGDKAVCLKPKSMSGKSWSCSPGLLISAPSP